LAHRIGYAAVTMSERVPWSDSVQTSTAVSSTFRTAKAFAWRPGLKRVVCPRFNGLGAKKLAIPAGIEMSTPLSFS
jgi:hypothetical protein